MCRRSADRPSRARITGSAGAPPASSSRKHWTAAVVRWSLLIRPDCTSMLLDPSGFVLRAKCGCPGPLMRGPTNPHIPLLPAYAVEPAKRNAWSSGDQLIRSVKVTPSRSAPWASRRSGLRQISPRAGGEGTSRSEVSRRQTSRRQVQEQGAPYDRSRECVIRRYASDHAGSDKRISSP